MDQRPVVATTINRRRAGTSTASTSSSTGCAAQRERHRLAGDGAGQGAGDRGGVGDAAGGRVGLVLAGQRHGAGLAVLGAVGDAAAELRRRDRPGRARSAGRWRGAAASSAGRGAAGRPAASSGAAASAVSSSAIRASISRRPRAVTRFGSGADRELRQHLRPRPVVLLHECTAHRPVPPRPTVSAMSGRRGNCLRSVDRRWTDGPDGLGCEPGVAEGERCCADWLLAADGGLRRRRRRSAREPVDLELVLLADATGSIDDVEIRLQRQGYADAMVDPQVLWAIDNGGAERADRGRLRRMGGGDRRRTWWSTGWWSRTRPRRGTFGARLMAAPRRAYGSNAIGAALLKGLGADRGATASTAGAR